MAMTDPVGDLLTRIRNGQSARLDSVTVPASRMRSNVLDVLQREGYIRGWFEEELRTGVKELRVELKYDNGQSGHQGDQARLHPGPPRLLQDPRAAAPLQRSRHLDPVHAARRHVRRRGARRQCRRRSHLQGVLTMSRVGKNPVAVPAGVTVDLKGQASQGQGQARRARSSSSMTTSRSPRTATTLDFKPRTDSRRARMQWGTARNLASNMVRGVSDGFTINLEINGVGYRAQADAKNLKLQLGFSHDVEVPIPGRHPDQGGQADRDRDHRRGSSEGRPARGGDPQPASARALQGQGHQVLDRDDPAQGRQEEVEAITSWPTRKALFARRQRRARYALRQAAGDRPRLSVFRSGKHIYAQVIDDRKGATLAAASSLDEGAQGQAQDRRQQGGRDRGRQADRRARDRRRRQGSRLRPRRLQYHGRVAALANAAREGGLSF